MNSLTHTETFRIDQPVEMLFPLFSAEGEKRWVPGWDCQPLSGSDCTQEDFIFLTKSHDLDRQALRSSSLYRAVLPGRAGGKSGPGHGPLPGSGEWGN